MGMGRTLPFAGAAGVGFLVLATAAPASRGPSGSGAEENAASTRQIASLDELSWIAGHWAGEAFGGRIEEGWFEPDGRSMTGVFRLIQGERAVMYELLLLELDDDGEIYYRFKHVGRGWEPWEETALEYRLAELEGRRATFRSTAAAPPANAPWWFVYESPSEGELRIAMHDGEGGDPTILSMTRR